MFNEAFTKYSTKKIFFWLNRWWNSSLWKFLWVTCKRNEHKSHLSAPRFQSGTQTPAGFTALNMFILKGFKPKLWMKNLDISSFSLVYYVINYLTCVTLFSGGFKLMNITEQAFKINSSFYSKVRSSHLYRGGQSLSSPLWHHCDITPLCTDTPWTSASGLLAAMKRESHMIVITIFWFLPLDHRHISSINRLHLVLAPSCFGSILFWLHLVLAHQNSL